MCPASFDARNFGGAKFGIQSYEVPPPPRPLHGPCSSPQYAPAPVPQQATPSPTPSPVYNMSIEVFFHLASILQNSV